MRSELEQLEQIDRYLSGNMGANEMSAFEAQMNADPGLKSLVQDQELLIQTVNRQAIMAEINAVAGAAGAAAGGGAAWGLTQWIITSVSIIGATVGGIFIYNAVTEDEPVAENNPVEEIVMLDQDETTAPDTGEFISFEMSVEAYEEGDELSYDETHGENVEVLEAVDGDDGNQSQFENQLILNDGNNNNGNHHVNENAVYETNEQVESNLRANAKASFPGGPIAMKDWFSKHLMYPGTAKNSKVQATVRINFDIKADGSIEIIESDCFILKDEHGKPLTGVKRAKHRKSIKAFERQAAAAFRKNPKWLSATNTFGSPIKTSQVWYVNFVLNGRSSVYQLEDESGYLQDSDYYEDETELHDYQFLATDDSISIGFDR